MNTEKEITAIKERLDMMEESLEELSQVVFSACESTDEFELLDFTCEKKHSDAGTDQYTYQVTVRNTADVNQEFSGYVVFLDADDGEIHRDGIDFFSVAAGATHTQMGQAEIFDEIEMMKIADLEADVYALPQHLHLTAT